MKKVLIIDDDASVLDLMYHLMNALSFEPYLLIKPVAIFDTIESFKPDIIIMDVIMPEQDGLQTATMLRKHPAYASIPLILYSADQLKRTDALEAGADAFLEKPFDMYDMEKIMKQLLKD